MIVPMTKYELVLHADAADAFLNGLREVGLVDITTTGWEPADEDRALLALIEQVRGAIARLETVEAGEAKPYDSAQEALDHYRRITLAVESLTATIARLQSESREARVWGAFDASRIEALLDQGVEMRFYSDYDAHFAAHVEAWSGQYLIEPLARDAGMTYFVLIAPPLTDIQIDAQEVKIPPCDYRQLEEQAAHEQRQLDALDRELKRCAACMPLLRAELANLTQRLDFQQVRGSAVDQAEGRLLVMEGWAARENEARVDAFLESQAEVIPLKSKPMPDDDAPVLLKNNRYASLFELIGGFYSLPKYGTMDLTPYFAPFYMIFFGFCLCDGGYGLLLLAAGIVLKIRRVKGLLAQVAGLTIWLGAATILFGLLTGGFFGYDIYRLMPRFEVYKLQSMDLFILALAFGAVQILFGMLLKVIATTQQLGFKYALSTLGWMVVLASTLAAVVLPQAGVAGFTTSSPLYLALVGVGGFSMLFLNSPGKNPLANFGAGLWNTYNDVSGFVGDFLSYIRLFAIGLSGGILALVFNDLAFGLAPDIPVVKQIVVLFILLFGHGINIFMSCLSAFVHPLRLTFVEFYKNAGFESTQRAFHPFKKNN